MERMGATNINDLAQMSGQVVLSIEAGNRHALAGWSTRSTPRWRWSWRWWELVGGVLMVGAGELGAGASRICVDVDLPLVQE
jgi:hypothetical protein